ncbi:MAG: TVP38/TMEM64 family protein [Desulfomonilaceae bacterium]|nr:TVP38/TMEM64 family protein [Desulfomonilaceae bacterium]
MREDSEREMTATRSRNRWLVGIVCAAFVVALIVAGTTLLPVRDYLVAALEWTRSLGAWGPIFLTLFYIVACLVFLPGSVLTLGAGFLFGVPIGLLSAWTGATLGACAAFLVGRTLARDWVVGKVSANPKFTAVDEAVGREGFKIVLLLRLSPVFPFNFLNYALGLTKVSFGNYAIASVIGMLPGGLMYVYFGSAARSLADVAAGKVEGGWAGQVFFWLGLAATIIVAGFVTRLARKSLRHVESASETSERCMDANDLMQKE